MELTVVPITKPDAANFIFGQSHFIKTVEDLHEALVGAVPGIRFGLAFCEASGKRLVRWSGNDEPALTLARDNALAIGAGHTFLIFLGDGFFPVMCWPRFARYRRFAASIVQRQIRHR